MTAPDAMRRLLEQATRELRRLRAEHAELVARAREPIAVVGLACRFPGGADDPASYWRVLIEGRDVVREIPASRWPHDAALAGLRGARWAGLLDGPLADFDAEFFAISPREARSLDPQQRLLLELAWESLEDAGLALDRLPDRDVGVFVGLSNLDYGERAAAGPLDAYSATGNLQSTAAGRLAHTLDLHGPCLAVDTACSSSLVAVHLALHSLQRRECSLALAGGAHLILSPRTMEKVARTQSLAPDGRCKTFDARADGFVRGEGCGVLALKRLADAVRDGDPIRAVLRGSAVGHDGHAAGLTAPNARAQQRLHRAALAHADLHARDISCIEAHGTGTALGDPIEVEALQAVYGAPRGDGSTVALASVKTNLGHLEAAAGVAGLIKLILALEHGQIPPHLHLTRPNPRIRLDDGALEIPTRPRPWPRGPVPRRAAVSSFGISGTNAHVIVEEAPPHLSSGPAPQPDPHLSSGPAPAVVLPLSARSPGALRDLLARYRTFLAATPHAPAAVAHAIAVGRTQEPWRRALVGRTAAELAHAAAAAEPPTSPACGRPRVVFVCPGQGSQWPGMALRLADEEPAFREALAACAAAIRRHAGWDLHARLAAPLTAIDEVQPALFAYAVALAAVWRAWGVEPDALVGHSMGEVAAAHLAGALDLDSAARVICTRSRLMRRLAGQGAMALVDLDEPAARAAVADHPALAIAAVNGPRTTLLSGPEAALERVLADLRARDVFVRRVQVDVASHCALVDPILAPLIAELADLSPGPAATPLHSTVTARPIDGRALDGRYWARNLRDPVRFADVVRDLAADAVFIELSPHPVLVPAIAAAGAHALASVTRDSDEPLALRAALAAVFEAGHPISWARPDPTRPRVALPHYPWQRQPHWIDPPAAAAAPRGLPGLRRSSADDPDLHTWDTTLAADDPTLADHRVDGRVVVPAAAITLIILRALAELDDPRWQIHELRFERLIELGEAPTHLQLTLRRGGLRGSAAVHARTGDADPWLRHASATLERTATHDLTAAPAPTPDPASARAHDLTATPDPASARTHDPTAAPDLASARTHDLTAAHDLASARARCTAPLAPADHAATLAAAGLDFGPRYRCIDELRTAPGEALLHARRPDGEGDPGPALLDACLQALHVAAGSPARRLLPTRLAAVRLAPLPDAVWCHAVVRGDDPLRGDLSIYAADARLLGRITGLEVRPADAPRDDNFYAIAWTPLPTPDAPRSPHAVDPDSSSTHLPVAGDPASPPAPLRIASDPDSSSTHLPIAGDPASPPAAIRVAGDPELAAALARKLATRDVPATHHALADLAAYGRPPAALVVLLPGAPPEDPARAATDHLTDLVALTRAVIRRGDRDPPRLVFVTRGAQPAGHAPGDRLDHAPAWGLGRSVMHEHPELRCTLVDLDPAGPDPAELAALADILLAPDGEDQLALRRAPVPTDLSLQPSAPVPTDLSLQPSTPVPADLSPPPSAPVPADLSIPPPSHSNLSPTPPSDLPLAPPAPSGLPLASSYPSDPPRSDLSVETARVVRLVARLRLDPPRPEPAPAGARPFALTQPRPGVLDGLTLRAAPRRAPRPGHVELAVEAAGLNFLDVLLALDVLRDASSDPPLGGECVGTITAVGDGVTDLRPGDRVLALAARCFATHAHALALHCAPVPAALTPHEAATLPIAGLTAVHALDHVARVRPGDRVLIHAAAGGVGLIALQLARARGAEVFATAGSELKRQLLLTRGAHHVASSRDLSFVDLVRRQTRGEGVDIVLNSLAGELLTASLELLRPGGRFVELGKRDYLDDRRVGLRPFLRRIGWTLVDLRGLARDEPARVRAALDDLLALVAAGTLTPIPHRVVPVAAARDAFAAMARGEHTGKLVLDLADAARTPILPPVDRPVLRDDGVVLITGGTGGVGLALARWLVDRGVRRLALLARDPLESPALAELRRDAAVQLLRADVADEPALAAALAAIDGPLAGVIHAAGVLDDGAVMNTTPAQVARVAAPKIAGAWHLHRLTERLPLEFFALCGSASAVLGSPGQAAYAGANACLAALAAHRRARGLPATCVDWGPWDAVGLAAARPDRGLRLAGQGLESMSPGTAASALGALLAHGTTARAVMRLHVRRWRESHLAVARAPLLADLDAAAPTSAGLRPRLAALAPDERLAATTAHLRDAVARVLRRPAAGLGLDDPLQQTGLDSLMAMELRNRLEAELGLALSVTLIWRHPTLRALAAHLAGLIAPAAQPASTSPEGHVPSTLSRPAETPTARPAPTSPEGHVPSTLSRPAETRPAPTSPEGQVPSNLSQPPADPPTPAVSPALAGLLAAVARLARAAPEDP